MTGKELIVYILEHDLVNEEIFKDNHCALFMTDMEVAALLGTGPSTVRAMYSMGLLRGFEVGNSLFLLKDYVRPRNDTIEKGADRNE